MSRIGRMPIAVPAGVNVTIDGTLVTVKGPKGTLAQQLCPEMDIIIEENIITIKRPTDEKEHKARHGLTRSLLFNLVEGVSNGFKKELEVNGTGYRAQKQGSQLIMNLGYSHQVIIDEIEGISIDVPSPNKVIISGCDKQKVGQFAADVRKKRPPEPYKGKGVKYADEHIRRKEGKAGKTAK